MPLAELLGRTRSMVNGATIVTNAVAELRGSAVGLIVTKGTRDTLRIARSARTNNYDRRSPSACSGPSRTRPTSS